MSIWVRTHFGTVLWPFSVVYGGGIRLRKFLYDYDILSSIRLNTKVISIGNITVGGTGKTPLVGRVAKLFREKGYKVVVSSRGYRRKYKRAVIVSDERGIRLRPEEAGDEPYLLARRLPGVPVVVGKDRAKVGKLALNTWDCDVLLLDDSFQHLKIKRDLDIVVIDSTNPWGNGKLLPSGRLREPLSGLKRADVIVFSRCDESCDLDKKVARLGEITDVPVFWANHRPVEWVSFPYSKIHPLDFLKKKPVLAFAGMGNPRSFQDSVEALGIEVLKFLRYRNHYWYRPKDLNRIARIAKRIGAVALVTTEKDGVRIPRSIDCKIPIYFLRIELEIGGGIENLKKVLFSVF